MPLVETGTAIRRPSAIRSELEQEVVVRDGVTTPEDQAVAVAPLHRTVEGTAVAAAVAAEAAAVAAVTAEVAGEAPEDHHAHHHRGSWAETPGG